MLASIAGPKAELVNYFIKSGSFKVNTVNQFTLASGKPSPYYVDCKSLMADPNNRKIISQLSFEKIEDLKNNEFDCVGGLEIGAIQISTVISDYAHAKAKKNWQTFVVRKKQKGHGLGKIIEGAAYSGNRALIVDDVLTSGGSIIQAIHATQEAGLIVTHALVIVDRQEQEGRQKVEDLGVSLISLLTLDDLKTAGQSI